MSEMVERVALAIRMRGQIAMDAPYDAIMEWHRDQARAAIEAMREPTEAMDLAGVKAESYRSLGLLKARHIWRSMIDAALSEDVK